MEETIKTKIQKAFAPDYLQVINESGLHRGHAGDDGSGQSHFKLIVVSDALTAMSRIDRQRAIYNVLREEMKEQIHALSIQTKINQ